MEADYEQFKINQEYLELVPRPTSVEKQAMDLDLIERGQIEPIKVGNDMTILDGYIIFDLLSQRGKKIKYEFREFEDKESERNYVFKTNIMRRHLNPFQRIESTVNFYRKNNMDEYKKSYVDIILSIKEGNKTSLDISNHTGRNRNRVNEALREMAEGYYIRRDMSAQEHVFSVLPKGEEFISKSKPKATSTMIGKIVNVERSRVGNALYLIDNAPPIMLDQLRRGVIRISTAYQELTGVKRGGSNNARKYDLECPHCKHISYRSNFRKIYN